jgi:hypothetical protein
VVDPKVSGKEVLQALVRTHREEYNTLMVDEKAELVQEFEEHKANKTCSL